jgi:hypothetical protein
VDFSKRAPAHDHGDPSRPTPAFCAYSNIQLDLRATRRGLFSTKKDQAEHPLLAANSRVSGFRAIEIVHWLPHRIPMGSKTSLGPIEPHISAQGRYSSLKGEKTSTPPGSSRASAACSTSPLIDQLSPGSTSYVSPPIVNLIRPDTRYPVCSWGCV